MTTADTLSKTFAALSDPTRRAILARLARGEASVTELAAPFDLSLPAISKHLKVLERAGLIVRGREAQWRPARLQPGPLKDVADWLDHYRDFWEKRFDRLDDLLRAIQVEERSSGDDADGGKSSGRAQDYGGRLSDNHYEDKRHARNESKEEQYEHNG